MTILPLTCGMPDFSKIPPEECAKMIQLQTALDKQGPNITTDALQGQFHVKMAKAQLCLVAF